ncbi:hypothetical protein nbrc107696_21300 [Gordonia spumicola]|uniref:SnoaL-like domain-containing protein n=1 Tax=Gordonia spumicola TaxID=589161 RepID=A0A7I9V8W4_9ACTN|nr:hypothetical protein [Gordonia spumicola]GEE01684.1 hypothetical protein nbrc107696_21300 [Gordonia spumicola]
MADLTKKEMEEILLAHEIAELEQDVEATMATLVENPHYELVFFGLQVDGRDAIREVYKRILNDAGGVAAEKRVHAVAPNTLIREAHMTFTDDDGERINGLYLVVMSFDPETKKISGERMYQDPNFAGLMAKNLGPDFENLPGVSRIGDSAPTIEVHDAFKYAEAAGTPIKAVAR